MRFFSYDNAVEFRNWIIEQVKKSTNSNDVAKLTQLKADFQINYTDLTAGETRKLQAAPISKGDCKPKASSPSGNEA